MNSLIQAAQRAPIKIPVYELDQRLISRFPQTARDVLKDIDRIIDAAPMGSKAMVRAKRYNQLISAIRAATGNSIPDTRFHRGIIYRGFLLNQH